MGFLDADSTDGLWKISRLSNATLSFAPRFRAGDFTADRAGKGSERLGFGKGYEVGNVNASPAAQCEK